MADSIESLDKKAEALEGTAGGYGTPVLSGPGGSALARLNTGLTTLFTIVDSPDEAPTTQAAKMFDDLQQALSAQLAAWKQMKERDVPALNQALRKAGLPATDSRLKEEIEPGRYGTTTEEP